MCCQGSSRALNHLPTAKIKNPCGFTLEQIRVWKSLLICYKQKEPKANLTQVNSYLGIVVSAISYGENFCYFNSELSQVEPFILTILNSHLCP